MVQTDNFFEFSIIPTNTHDFFELLLIILMSIANSNLYS